VLAEAGSSFRPRAGLLGRSCDSRMERQDLLSSIDAEIAQLTNRIRHAQEVPIRSSPGVKPSEYRRSYSYSKSLRTRSPQPTRSTGIAAPPLRLPISDTLQKPNQSESPCALCATCVPGRRKQRYFSAEMEVEFEVAIEGQPSRFQCAGDRIAVIDTEFY